MAANGYNIGNAYVNIVPSFSGAKDSIARGLDNPAMEGGKSGGRRFLSGFGDTLKGGMKTVGTTALASFGVGIGIGAVTSGITNLAKDAMSTRTAFDTAMSQVAATGGKTMDELRSEVTSTSTAYGDFEGNLEQFAQFMGANTAFSASQAAEGLNYMALAGYSAQDSVEMLPNVLTLAAAGSMELGAASDMLTDVQSALGLTFEDTAVLVDQMAAAAANSNTSVEQLGDAFLRVGGTAQNMSGGTLEAATALGILANNGIKGAEGGTALRNILLAMNPKSDAAAAAMENLGLSFYDAAGEMRPLNESFSDLAWSLGNMSTQEKSKALTAIFNKVDLKSATALMAGCVEGVDMLDIQLSALFGSLGEEGDDSEMVAIFGRINEALNDEGMAVENLADLLIDTFDEQGKATEATRQKMLDLGISAEDADFIMQGLADTTISSTTAWESLNSAIDASWYTTKSLSESMLDAGINFDAASSNLELLGVDADELSAALGSCGGDAEVFAQLLQESATEGVSLDDVIGAMGGSLETLQTAFDNTTGAAQQMADTQLDNLGGSITLAQSAFEGLQLAVTDKAAPALKEYVDSGTELMSGLTAAINEGGMGAGLDFLKDKFIEFGESVKDDAIASLSERFPEAASAFQIASDNLGEPLANLGTAISTAADALGTALAPAFDAISALFTDKTEPDVDAMATTFSTTLADGINAATTFITETAVPAIESFGTFVEETVPKVEAFATSASDTLTTAWQTASTFITETALPAITGIQTFITDTAVPAVEGFATSASETLGGAWQTASTILTETVLPAITGVQTFVVETAVPAVESFATAGSDTLTTAWSGASTLFTETVLPALTGVADYITGTVIPAVETFAGDPLGTMSTALEDAKGKLTDLGTELSEKYPEASAAAQTVAESFQENFGGVWTAVGESFGGVWDTLTSSLGGEDFSSTLDTITGKFEVFGPFIETAVTALGDLASSAIPVVQAAIETYESIVSPIREALIGVAETTLPALATTLEGLVTPITNVFTAMSDSPVIESVKGLIDKAAELMPGVVEAAGTLVEGGLAGIQAFIENAGPGVSDFVDSLGSAGETIIPALQTAAENLNPFLETMGGFLGTVVGFAGDLESKIVEFLAPGIADFITGISALPTDITTAIGDATTWLTTTGVDILTGLASGAEAGFAVFSGWLTGLPGNVVTFIGDVIETLQTKGTELISGLSAGAEAGFAVLQGWVEGIPESIKGFFSDVTGTLWQKGCDFVSGLSEGFKSIFNGTGDGTIEGFVKSIPDKIVGFLTGVNDFAGTLLQAGKDLIGGMLEGIGSIFGSEGSEGETVVSFILGIPGKILDTITSIDIPNMLVSAGADLINGFKQGIEQFSLKQLLIDVFGDLAGPVCDVLGIESPSTVFADIGENVMAGAEEGVDEGSGPLNDALLGIANGLPGNFADAYWSMHDMGYGLGVSFGVGMTNAFSREVLPGLSGYGSLISSWFSSGAGYYTLWDAGQSIMAGLGDSMVGYFNRVITSQLQSITNAIPSWKGPIDRDRDLLTGSGEAIMEGLNEGIEIGAADVRDTLTSLTSEIGSSIDASPVEPSDSVARGGIVVNLAGAFDNARISFRERRDMEEFSRMMADSIVSSDWGRYQIA